MWDAGSIANLFTKESNEKVSKLNAAKSQMDSGDGEEFRGLVTKTNMDNFIDTVGGNILPDKKTYRIVVAGCGGMDTQSGLWAFVVPAVTALQARLKREGVHFEVVWLSNQFALEDSQQKAVDLLKTAGIPGLSIHGMDIALREEGETGYLKKKKIVKMITGRDV